jgi:hypothetical protein
MNCESVKKSLPLLFYGELPFEDEQLLQEHLDACDPCRQAFGVEERIHQSLGARNLEAPAPLLARCRMDLAARVAEAGHAGGGWRFWFGPPFRWQAVLRPLSAVALVALGFLSARWTAVGPGSDVPAGSPEGTVISKVRQVRPDESGSVQIVVDETRQRLLTGSPEDEPIRRLLLVAAREAADPGLRGESMDILKARPELPEVRHALLQALQHDPNPGVRLKALEALKLHAAQPDVRNALAGALLSDENPGVRTQAIDLLIQNKEPDLVGILQELMQKDDNSYVRLRSRRTLQEMNASIGTF